MLACLRPVRARDRRLPGDLGGLNKNYDAAGHYARTFPLQAQPALLPGTPMNSAADHRRCQAAG